MTTEPEASEDTPMELSVMLQDREVYVRMPTPEQLLVWQRTIKKLADAPIDASWTGSEVMQSLERLRKIVDSLMVNKADVEWLDDQFLDGTLTFQKMAPFITDIVTTFERAATDQIQETGTRAEKRAKPAKKASRKAPVR